jgi:hypothetical protein
MVIKEFFETRPDGVNLYRTYSDEGYYLIQNETGAEYEEAIDIEHAPYTYSETNKKIDGSSEPDIDDSAIYNELVNVYMKGVNSIDE